MFSGNNIAKNSIYNFLGLTLPLIIAVIVLPLLIKKLGIERFGILNIAWIIIGYFTIFDFGLGRAITKLVAEKLNKISNFAKHVISEIFWTSNLIIFIFGVLGAMILLLFSHFYSLSLFNISENLRKESLYSFYLLSVTVPLITLTAGLRGFLEAYQKFAFINILRFFNGIINFGLPLLILEFTNSLVSVIIGLIFTRIMLVVLYFIKCVKTEPSASKISFQKKAISPLFNLSGWMTVSNIISPVLVYFDKFLIGSILTVSAISYYAPAFELVTKFLIIASSIANVAFPAFSYYYETNLTNVKKMFTRGLKIIFILVFPLTIFLITFSYEIIDLWLGHDFAVRSSSIIKLLSLGLLFNSLAHIPFSFIQGIGKPILTAKAHFLELPLYLLLLWMGISNFGLNGAALVWSFRCFLDMLILFYFSTNFINFEQPNYLKIIGFIILTIMMLIIAFLINGTIYKVSFILFFILILSIITFKIILTIEEKKYILSLIKNKK